MPRSEQLPVLACEPGTFLNIHNVELDHFGMERVARDYSLTVAQLREKVVEERAAAIKTYNPTGAQFTPPQVNATRDLFGFIQGFRTNLGPISFPRGPVKGYIWDQEFSWILHACPPGQRRRGARGSGR